MSVYAGTVVLYKTNNGQVAALTTQHYSGASASVATAADVTAASADFADLILIGESNARYYKVARYTGATTFGGSPTVGQYWIAT